MRILQVIPSLGPAGGGGNVSCLELSKALQAQGASVTIFSISLDRPQDSIVSARIPNLIEGVEVYVFPAVGNLRLWISYPMYRALRDRVREFDIVHIHSFYRFHFPVTVHFCRKFGIPYVIKPHGSLDPFLFARRRWIKALHEFLFERPALRNAAAIQFTAEEEMSLAYSTGIFGESKDAGIVIPNGVVVPEGMSVPACESRRFTEQFPSTAGKKIVLFLGRINYKKGLDLLVPAFRKVLDDIPTAHLVIVGPDSEGYRSKVEGWVKQAGLENDVTFTGPLYGDAKSAAFTAAQVFCLPSYTENFGIAIFEALSLGCPVVISDRVNVWREVVQAKAGLAVPCEVDKIGEALKHLLSNKSIAEEMGLRGANFVRENYLWKTSAEKMMNVYHTILKKRKAGRLHKPII